MTTAVLISLTGHIVGAGIHNYFLPLPIQTLCLQLGLLLVIVLQLVGDSSRLWTLSSLAWSRWL